MWVSSKLRKRANAMRFVSINESYFMSVHIEMLLDNNNKKGEKKRCIQYTTVSTGLWTINLTTGFIISLFYKISLTLLQALKSHPFFWNNSVCNRTFKQYAFCVCIVGSPACENQKRHKAYWVELFQTQLHQTCIVMYAFSICHGIKPVGWPSFCFKVLPELTFISDG